MIQTNRTLERAAKNFPKCSGKKTLSIAKATIAKADATHAPAGTCKNDNNDLKTQK